MAQVSEARKYRTKLKDEKNRAQSKILLDGFASLNQNVLNVEDMDATQLEKTIAAAGPTPDGPAGLQ